MFGKMFLVQMKNIASRISLVAAGWLALSWALVSAQSSNRSAGTLSTPPGSAESSPVVSVAAARPPPPKFELSMKWNERGTNGLNAPFRNDSDRPMIVYGVQATRGIFIGNYPARLGPGKQDNITFFYDSADNTDGDTDLIRLLTDQGIKEILVKIAREEVLRLDTRELRWTASGAADTKTVTVTATAGTVAPVGVHATGGHQAVLEAIDASTWRVKVTPSSTARSGQFAVFVELNQALPGKAAVILGVIQPKE